MKNLLCLFIVLTCLFNGCSSDEGLPEFPNNPNEAVGMKPIYLMVIIGKRFQRPKRNRSKT
ncbi:MAG: hypothetical protein HC803_04255 [Saprospiraceae bacterium]|nr:hypothetical protein [Saprospiraceae bacterium]